MGPFRVNPDNAKEALQAAWGEDYACFDFEDGLYSAHSRQAPHSEKITGETPDELTANLRRDFLRRQGSAGIPAQRGPEGMGPS
jgi:hypothetical protein